MRHRDYRTAYMWLAGYMVVLIGEAFIADDALVLHIIASLWMALCMGMAIFYGWSQARREWSLELSEIVKLVENIGRWARRR